MNVELTSGGGGGTTSQATGDKDSLIETTEPTVIAVAIAAIIYVGYGVIR